MLVLILLLLIPNNDASNAGTVLFRGKVPEDCWTEIDLAKLRARRAFEEIVPKDITADKVDSNFVKKTLRYFKAAVEYVEKTDKEAVPILTDALLDTLGGHLRTDILPTVRLAYYAGYIPFRSARRIHDFYDDIKMQMNTQGIGWTPPKRSIMWSNLTVSRILVGPAKLANPCARLVLKRDSNACIHLPVPKLDDPKFPSAMALPFKKGGLNSLLTSNSENLLLKYYTTASRCILSKSPKQCRHMDFVNFNNDLWHWMKRFVAPHLMDEQLYAAFNGVLRVAAAVQNYGKGLSRRNIYESYETKWNPWKYISDKNIYINADWTPQVYLIVIVLVGVLICLLQICYGFVFGYSGRCRCKRTVDEKGTPPVVRCGSALASGDLPTVLPPQSCRSSMKSECVGPSEKQCMEFFNNTMPVIMSPCDASDLDLTSATSRLESEEECINSTVIEVNSAYSLGTKSPPKIDTDMTHLTINKSSIVNESRQPMYTTISTTFQDDCNCTDTAWTGSLTSTSPRSLSSTSVKHTTRSSRMCRDLAWARRVLYKQSADQTPRSTTKDSFTTTPTLSRNRQY